MAENQNIQVIRGDPMNVGAGITDPADTPEVEVHKFYGVEYDMAERERREAEAKAAREAEEARMQAEEEAAAEHVRNLESEVERLKRELEQARAESEPA